MFSGVYCPRVLSRELELVDPCLWITKRRTVWVFWVAAAARSVWKLLAGFVLEAQMFQLMWHGRKLHPTEKSART